MRNDRSDTMDDGGSSNDNAISGAIVRKVKKPKKKRFKVGSFFSPSETDVVACSTIPVCPFFCLVRKAKMMLI